MKELVREIAGTKAPGKTAAGSALHHPATPSFFILETLLLLSFLVSCNKHITGGDKSDRKQDGVMISVTETGAVGDGAADDTKAFQEAIDYAASRGGGTVLVPAGNYLINVDTAVKIRSHITLQMDSAATLVAMPTRSERYYVLLVANAEDVQIYGGNVKGDRAVHSGTTGEWGMGIGVYGSRQVTIYGTRIYDCWGDGLVIGARSGAPVYAPGPSKNITVRQVTSKSNRRQAITIGKANGVLIDSCILTHTQGTKPMAGIDIEPDRDTAQNITIQNCELAYNKGPGVEIYVNANSVVRNVIVQNNFIHHNTYGGYLVRAHHVSFTGNRIVQNKYAPPVRAKDTVNCSLNHNTYE